MPDTILVESDPECSAGPRYEHDVAVLGLAPSSILVPKGVLRATGAVKCEVATSAPIVAGRHLLRLLLPLLLGKGIGTMGLGDQLRDAIGGIEIPFLGVLQLQ